MFPVLHTLNFEAPEDPAGLETGGGGDEQFDYDADPEWSGPSQEEWQQVLQTNQMLQEAMTAAYAPQQQDGEQAGVIPDPYTQPEEYRDWLLQTIDERTAPIAGYQEQLQQQEGREAGMDKLDELQQSQGEFLNPEASRAEAYSRAERYYPEMVARFGDTPRAADAALAKGYKEQRDYEQAVGQAYYDRELNQLATLSGAPRDMGAAGAQGAQQTEIPQGDEMAVVGKYFQS